MEPVIEAVAISSCPSRMANTVMISSAALPKVAFSTPPTFGPVLAPSCSVATPTTQASSTSARPETTNTAVFGADARSRAPATAAMTAAAPTDRVSNRLRPRITGGIVSTVAAATGSPYSTNAPIRSNFWRRSRRRSAGGSVSRNSRSAAMASASSSAALP